MKCTFFLKVARLNLHVIMYTILKKTSLIQIYYILQNWVNYPTNFFYRNNSDKKLKKKTENECFFKNIETKKLLTRQSKNIKTKIDISIGCRLN